MAIQIICVKKVKKKDKEGIFTSQFLYNQKLIRMLKFKMY